MSDNVNSSVELGDTCSTFCTYNLSTSHKAQLLPRWDSPFRRQANTLAFTRIPWRQANTKSSVPFRTPGSDLPDGLLRYQHVSPWPNSVVSSNNPSESQAGLGAGSAASGLNSQERAPGFPFERRSRRRYWYSVARTDGKLGRSPLVPPPGAVRLQ